MSHLMWDISVAKAANHVVSCLVPHDSINAIDRVTENFIHQQAEVNEANDYNYICKYPKRI